MGRSSKSTSEKASVRSQPRTVKKHDDYTSEGVVDTDVFLLPASDYQTLILVTVVAAVVRLFRIYQPSSVVFDEVQYVFDAYVSFPRR
jgi:dolichyl-phosphate-mannose-protein mannosyltransferase